MTELKSDGLLAYAQVCGETLARGHARSGDPATLAGYIGTSTRFDQAIVKFAVAYADQTERDWEALVRSRRHSNAGPKRSAKVAEKQARLNTAAKSNGASARKTKKAK
jgi:hypothetical protein